MAEQVKLLGFWGSPYGRRVELALRLKGVQFEYVEEDISNKSPLLLQSNPVHKKVPVLLHNGKPIAESLAILEYIDETWPNNPLLPKDPYDRAIARFWAKFVDEKIDQTAFKCLRVTGKEQEEAIEEVHQNLKLLENELKDKFFFGGEAIGFLDIVAFYIIYLFLIHQEAGGLSFFPEGKFPALHKWTGKLCEIDVVKESSHNYLAYFKASIEAMKSAPK